MKAHVQEWRNHKAEAAFGLTTASIPVIGFLIFGLTPLVISLILSLNTPKGYSLTGMSFVGLANFVFVLKDPLFWKSCLNTLYSLIGVPLGMALGLFLAIILNQDDLKGRNFFKSVFFIPYVTSVIATTIVWKFLLDKNFGLVNQILNVFGIDNVDFLGNDKLVMPTMIFLQLWSGVGFQIILYSAALTTIDPTLYEAAEIDGANPFQRFFHITLPGISNITFFLLITGVINGLQDFARFQAMLPNGGPNSSGLTIVFYLYQKGWSEMVTYGMGVASAASWILAALCVGVTFFQFRFYKDDDSKKVRAR